MRYFLAFDTAGMLKLYSIMNREKPMRLALMLTSLALALPISAAESLSVAINMVGGEGKLKAIGQIRVEQSPYGLVFSPDLTGLTPGLHGFHVHQNPSCAPSEKDGAKVAAGAAGAHLDPSGSNRHGTPWGDGHLGDLPPLYVNAQGKAIQPVLAPRLKLSDLKSRSLMLHAGADNHSDHPEMLGGGGARVACGVIN